MASLVTSELFRLLPERGLGVLRFNFRGVGASEGTYGEGRAERADIVAALDALAGLWPHRPLVLCGWSFGGDTSLSVVDDRLDGWVAIAPPLRIIPVDELTAAAGDDPRPKLLIVPEHDQFRTPAAAAEATDVWVNTRIEPIAGADHFLVGRTDKVSRLVAAFVGELSV
jgi:alpha/beta superfamily hydrolase